jgi:hypothetical protein
MAEALVTLAWTAAITVAPRPAHTRISGITPRSRPQDSNRTTSASGGTARLQRGTPWTTVVAIPKKSDGSWPYPVGVSRLAG